MGGWLYHRDAFRNWIFSAAQLIAFFPNLVAFMLNSSTLSKFIDLSIKLSGEGELTIGGTFEINQKKSFMYYPPPILSMLRIVSDINDVMPLEDD